MRKRSLLFVGLIVLVMLTVGCASMYPAKESPGDCLLIIPTEFIQGPGTDKARTYYTEFSNMDSNKAIPSGRYSKITVLQETGGNKITALTSRVTHANYSGDPTSQAMDIPLPYEAGKVIISDFKIVYSIEKTKSRESVSKCEFISLTEQDKTAYMDEYKADGALESWF